MRDLEGPLLLVGCGKMGGAMLAGWLNRGLDPAETHVVEPNKAALGELADQVRHYADVSSLPATLKPRAAVLAVKPQMMASALPGCRRFVGPGTLFLSIAAGKTMAYFERELGRGPLVRAMPNTPAAIARGISVAVANADVTKDQKEQADLLLKAVGEVAWVDQEALIGMRPSEQGEFEQRQRLEDHRIGRSHGYRLAKHRCRSPGARRFGFIDEARRLLEPGRVEDGAGAQEHQPW